MKFKWDNLTADETAEEIREGFAYLTDEQTYAVLNAVLTDEEKAECVLAWGEA